jgi:hypothetical protein
MLWEVDIKFWSFPIRPDVKNHKTSLDNMNLNYAYMDGKSKNRLQEVRRFENNPELQYF